MSAAARPSLTIPEQIAAERALAGTPRVAAVPAGYTAALALALRHARARLRLPASLPVVWHAAPGGNEGECWHLDDGRVELHVNVALDSPPGRIAWVGLHEARHVIDGSDRGGKSYAEAERDANAFACEAARHPDFLELDWRRPSVARRGFLMHDTRPAISQSEHVPNVRHDARRRALLAEGEQLASRAERAGRGFTPGEQRRATAILAELDGLGAATPSRAVHTVPIPAAGSVLARQRCRLCGSLRPQWERCSCGALGWAFTN